MTPIRRPLSPGSGWVNVSLYRAYADQAREAVLNERYFEAILICCIGLDVLVNAMPDAVLTHHSEKLSSSQRTSSGRIGRKQLTVGQIIIELDSNGIIYKRLSNALRSLNGMRNRVIHPIARGILKQDAITPQGASKNDAETFLRHFSHVIDMAGGKSPRSEERELNRYVAERKRSFRKHFSRP